MLVCSPAHVVVVRPVAARQRVDGEGEGWGEGQCRDTAVHVGALKLPIVPKTPFNEVAGEEVGQLLYVGRLLSVLKKHQKKYISFLGLWDISKQYDTM